MRKKIISNLALIFLNTLCVAFLNPWHVRVDHLFPTIWKIWKNKVWTKYWLGPFDATLKPWSIASTRARWKWSHSCNTNFQFISVKMGHERGGRGEQGKEIQALEVEFQCMSFSLSVLIGSMGTVSLYWISKRSFSRIACLTRAVGWLSVFWFWWMIQVLIFWSFISAVARFVLFVIAPNWVANGLRDSMVGGVFCLVLGVIFVVVEIQGVGGLTDCSCSCRCFFCCIGIGLLFLFTIFYLSWGAWWRTFWRNIDAYPICRLSFVIVNLL